MTFILFPFIISMVLLMIILITVDDFAVLVDADVGNPVDVDAYSMVFIKNHTVEKG